MPSRELVHSAVFRSAGGWGCYILLLFMTAILSQSCTLATSVPLLRVGVSAQEADCASDPLTKAGKRG